jgi:hypothetical protein
MASSAYAAVPLLVPRPALNRRCDPETTSRLFPKRRSLRTRGFTGISRPARACQQLADELAGLTCPGADTGPYRGLLLRRARRRIGSAGGEAQYMGAEKFLKLGLGDGLVEQLLEGQPADQGGGAARDVLRGHNELHAVSCGQLGEHHRVAIEQLLVSSGHPRAQLCLPRSVSPELH